jgi:UDP-2-acetamido-2,6-beta-L-arabino-hexul-4-ose reductase
MSIVGDGDIAEVLPKRNDLLFFASGVSNSLCTDEKEYDREVRLLLSQDDRAHVVYFSSLAVLYSDTRYFCHKRYMEALIRESFPVYTLVRIGNITWGNNPRTLINYLRAHPTAEIRDEYRYIVDKDEFLYWVNLIPEWSCEMNIPGQRMKIKEVKERYCA